MSSPVSELRCTLCGGTENSTPAIQESGWFQCRHCGDLVGVEGAGVLITEAPGGKITEIARPGRREYLIRLGYSLEGATFMTAVFLDLFGALCLRLLHGLAPNHLWAGIPLYAGIIGVIIWVRLRNTRTQHLDVDPSGALQLSRKIGRRLTSTIRMRLGELTFRREPANPTDEARPRLIFGHGDREVAALNFDSRGDRDWLAERVQDLDRLRPDEELGETDRCNGCGGRLGPRKQLVDRGSLNCPHCGTGLLFTEQGLELPPVDLSLFPEYDAKPRPERASVKQSPDSITIAVPRSPWKRTNFIYLGLFAGLLALLVWPASYIVEYVTVIPIIATGALIALAVPVVIGFNEIAEYWLVHREIELTEASCEMHQRVGSWRYRRKQFPITRLLELSITHHAERFRIQYRCALRSGEVYIPARQQASVDALARFHDELRSRAEALGRTETRKPVSA